MNLKTIYKSQNIPDYFPFGMRMSERSSNSSDYRYGFNGMEKDDEIKGNGNSYDFGARIYDPRIGRWASLDPQSINYPYASPFNFVLNSPICFIDPNGEEVILHGEDASATLTEIKKVTSIEISMNEDGKLTAQIPLGSPSLNELDMALLEAILDDDVNVNLYTTKAEFFDSKDGRETIPILIGGYDGSECINGKLETTQIFNLDQSKKVEDAGLSTPGTDAAHEILESYYGAKDDPEGNYKSGYSAAHAKALAADKNAKDTGNYEDLATGDMGITDQNGDNPVKLTNKKNTSNKFNKPKKNE